MSASSIQTPPNLQPSMRLPWISSRFMAWKELKQNTPLVLVFAGFLAFILAIFGYDKYFNSPQPANQDAGAFYLIYVFINLFALTMGVFLFAPEKENKTAQLLRQLPISSGFAVRSKLFYGLISILCFVLIGAVFQGLELLCFQSTIKFDVRTAGTPAFPLIAFGAILFPFECYFWGALCSLAIKRTIYAAIAATACVVVASWLVPTIVASCFGYSIANRDFNFKVLAFLFLAKAFLLAVGVLAFQRAGTRWLGNSPQQRTTKRTNSHTVEASQSVVSNLTTHKALTAPTEIPVASSSEVYRVLIWQSFAQFKKEFLLAIAIGLPPAIMGWAFMFDAFGGSPPRSRVTQSIMTAIIGLGLMAWIGSLLTFSNDHREGRYRFFQQHVEQGRRLWFARLLPVVALAAISLLGIFATLIAAGLFSTRLSSPPIAGTGLASCFAIVTIISVGQYNSMLFRSGVFSFLFMILMTLGIGTWITLACVLGGNLLLFVLPIPFALLVITWWHSPAWLANKPGLLNAMAPHLAAAAFACTLIGGFFWARYTEYPPSEFSLAPLQRQYSFLDNERPPSLERSRLIRNAAAAMVHPDGQPMLNFNERTELLMAPTAVRELVDQGYLEKNAESLELIKSALLLDNPSAVLDPNSQIKRAQQVLRLRHLLAVAAQHAELNDELDVALDHWLQLVQLDEFFPIQERRTQPAFKALLRWAEFPRQTPERLKQAIDGLSFDATHWNRHANQTHFFGQLDFENSYQESHKDPSTNSFGTPALFFRMPNVLKRREMERSRRIAHESMIKMQLNPFVNRLATQSRLTLPSLFSNKSIQANLQALTRIQIEPQPSTLRVTSPIGMEYFQPYYGYQNNRLLLQEIQNRRYVQVRMGLIAWRLEHGTYPKNISDLAPKYFETPPLDLYYGGNFVYEPLGIDQDVNFETLDNSRIDRGTPFLLPWSTIEHFAAPPIAFSQNQTASYSDASNVVVHYHNDFSFELPQPKPSESGPEQ
ncbi:MAG: ABC-type transport system involved in multi-copper enzyme maturation permease subunit [Mariniblastus sp.]|jgi:ABC-type transport system involved in multi-copper enzyme maturation permease subunit